MILPPYTIDHQSAGHRRKRRWVIGLTVAFCLFYGLAFAFIAPYLLPFFGIPLVIMTFAVIWALPESRRAPTRVLSKFLFAFVTCLVGWPSYIALALPGLPWITMVRLTAIPLALILLVCVSTSKDFRTQVSSALKSTPLIWKLFVAFVVLEALSIFFSKSLFNSLDKFFVAQISWTAIFFASVYVFLTPGRIERMAAVLWAMAMLVGVIGFFEWRAEHVLWAGHIPGFLKINDPSVIATLAGNRRLGNGMYRVESTFSSPLALGEYMSLTIPFVIQFAVSGASPRVRWAAAVSIFFVLFVAFISGSRLGLIGCLLSTLLYVGVWSTLKWRRQPSSLLGPAVALAYPTIFLGLLALGTFIGRIRRVIWGTGGQQFSDDARREQWKIGIPKILHHPWGNGIGMGSQTLDFSPFGVQTIDSYYLSVLLEYGIIGFLIYFGMFAYAAYLSGRTSFSLKIDDGDYKFAVPIAIALMNFFIVKSVFSQEDNHALVFMILGMVVALVHRTGREHGIGVGRWTGPVDARHAA